MAGRLKLPPLECWACRHALLPADLARLGLLRVRAMDEGGPFFELRCPACKRENIAECNGAKHWFCFPPGNFGWFDRLLSGPLRRAELNARKQWYARRDGFRSWFFQVLPFAVAEPQRPSASSGAETPPRAAPEPPPRGPRAKTQETPKEDAKEARSQAREDTEGARQREPRRGKPAPISLAEANALLGLEPSANATEVKQAYRALAQKYHPDKFAHLDEDFVNLAQQRFLRIKEAFDALSVLHDS